MTIRIAIPDPEVVQRFDRPGPRYTSYPTAVEFHPGVGEGVYREHLARADREHAGEPLSLYIHLPFCAKHCSYCGCHVIATPQRDVAVEYLEYVGRELALVAALLPARRKLKTDMVRDQLAGKEMEVGRYYLERGEHLAAINRFKKVVADYSPPF